MNCSVIFSAHLLYEKLKPRTRVLCEGPLNSSSEVSVTVTSRIRIDLLFTVTIDTPAKWHDMARVPFFERKRN